MSIQSSPPLTLHFSLGRIPVMVEPTFWLVAALLGMAIRDMKLLLLWVAVVFVSVLIHELGHAVAAIAMGSGVAIRLYSFGGLCYHQPLGRWQSVVVSLAGPFAGFLFGGLTYALSHVFPPTSVLGLYFYEFLWFANIYWGLINLLPVPPLDGGHVALGVFGPTRRRMALLLGVVAAGAVVAWALSQRSIYLSLLFGWMGFQCYQAYSATEDLKPQKPQKPEPEALSRGWQALRSGNESEAARLGHLALAAARPGEESNAARDLLAWVALADGNARMALSHLEKVDPPQAARPFSLAMAYEAMGLPDRALPHALAAVEKEPSEAGASLAVRLLVGARRLDEAERLAREYTWKSPATRDSLLALLAASREDFDTAAALYAAAFESSGRAEDAYQAALCHARAGRTGEATEWLERAIQEGYDDLEAISEEPAFAEVRQMPAIAERLSAVKRSG